MVNSRPTDQPHGEVHSSRHGIPPRRKLESQLKLAPGFCGAKSYGNSHGHGPPGGRGQDAGYGKN